MRNGEAWKKPWSSAPTADETAEATSPPLFGPGTLAAALAAEAEGIGHIEFLAGSPRWVAGPARFPIVATLIDAQRAGRDGLMVYGVGE
jgi:hypothetical protein